MKKVLLLFAVFIILVAGMILTRNYLQYNNPFGISPKVTINNYDFNLYIAKTPKDKEIGLSKRQNLDQNYGMFFTFEKPDFYSFWMRNMNFPIDIIFIRESRIITIHPNVQPPKSENEALEIFKPKEPADAVLEINAGLSQRYNFKEGDKVTIENL